MTNNDLLRRLRYTFDLGDAKMMTIFAAADYKISREQVSKFLKRDEDSDFEECSDVLLAIFLNGLINHKRGRREGQQPEPEEVLSNNIIFKKLKIALDLKAEDILSILDLAGFSLSKHELSAFFRKVDHKHYRRCKDQILRNFLSGLQLKYRNEVEEDYDEESGLEEDVREESEQDGDEKEKAAFKWKRL